MPEAANNNITISIHSIEKARAPTEVVLGNSKYENWKIFKKP